MMSGDMLFLAGVFSIVMAFQAFLLPHTPPKKEGVRPWAFLESLKMLKAKQFAIFVAITFVVSTELEFFYILTAPFLQSESIGVSPANLPAVMTIAQFAEIFVMAFGLSWALKRYGMRRTLAIGVVAWPIRYVIFAIGGPAWLVIASLALHGFCYVFFFVAAFIYVDKVAPTRHPGFGPEHDRHRRPGARPVSGKPVRREDPGDVHYRDGHQLDGSVPGALCPDPPLCRGLPPLLPG